MADPLTITPEHQLERVRQIALALPAAAERLSHGAPGFHIIKGKFFAYFSNDLHGSGEMAVVVKTSGIEEQAMLIEAGETGVPSAVWSDPFAKAAASFIALISMIPGGLFDPSLTVGAGLGQITFPVFTDWLAPGIDLPALMLLFMAAYFAGVVQSPITVAAILFEMTGAYGMVLPIMLVSMLASLIAGRLCEPSIYDALAGQFLRRLGIDDAEDDQVEKVPRSR